MNRSVVLAAFSVSFSIGASAASAQELITFDSPYSLDLRFGSWAKPGTSLTSQPTFFETAATGYGSGYKAIYPTVVDISASSTLQLDVTVNAGSAGFLVDLDDGEGDQFQYAFGFGLMPGGGLSGGNEYILDQPYSNPYSVVQGNGTFDFSQVTGYNIELDPGTSTDRYDVNWNDLSAVNLSQSLTWNNTGGTGDGATWDVGTNQNWNNGSAPATYSDGSAVTFDDTTNNNQYSVTLNTTVSPGSVTVNNSLGNYTISGSGGISGAGSLTKMGSDTLTLSTVNGYSGGTTVSAGTLVVGVNGALPNGALAITGGTVQLAHNTGLAQLTSLAISPGGVLDITNNHFILTYADGTQATADANIRTLLTNGYNGGTWTGTGGITSTSAQGVANDHFAVGYADGADHIVHGLSSGQILVQYTLYGDADLDLSVTGNDFTILASNLGKVVNAWDKGDFDYDGSVTGNDFTKLVGNLGKTASGADIALPASDYAAVDAFAAANGLEAVLPEPASAGLLLMAGVGMLTRRRRNQRSS